MILVDIGNSGLRATRIDANSQFCDSSRVYRLSWDAAVGAQRKPIPAQNAGHNQRWCSLSDTEAFDWLVHQLDDATTDAWWISSVQRVALEQLSASIERLRPSARVHPITYRDVPMQLDVEKPERTGVDRLCAAWAAWSIRNELETVKQPVIVAQAGTAVTVDVVTANGTFLGGAIMPGLGLSLQFLAAGTDLLPWLGNHEVGVSPRLPGRNTAQAIAVGVNAALVGGTAHLVERYRREYPELAQAMVVVSGGDGELLIPHIPGPKKLIEYLVLHGVGRIAQSQA